MRMEEGENIAQYVSRIKESINAIRGANGKKYDDIVLSKLVRTLLPVYAIIFSIIQELRCILGNDLSLGVLVGRLIAFELSNYENYKPETLESTFKAKLLLKYFDEVK